jgi:arylsulfatase A
MIKLLLLFLVTGLMMLVLTMAMGVLPAHAAPNVLLVVVDDLGFRDLGAYGSTVNRTPNINTLAQQGMKMNGMYASPLCTPTRASLMTGAYPFRVGLPDVLYAGDPIGLNQAETTLPEYMRDLGYETALLGKWHLGDQYPFLPLQHGFNYFVGTPYTPAPWVDGGTTLSPMLLLHGNRLETIVPDHHRKFLPFRILHETGLFIERSLAAGKPFFAVWSPVGVHTPFYPLEEFLTAANGNTYRAEVEEIDWSMGELMKLLDRIGVADNTIVIFTSDNGGLRWRANNAPFRGYKGENLEGGHRVPCIVRWPGRVAAGSTNHTMVTIMDILPTLVALAGGNVPSEPKIDGKNITPILLGRTNGSPHRAYYYWKTKMYRSQVIGERLAAVRVGNFKLNLATGQLYNIVANPGENIDVAAQYPQVVQELRAVAKELSRESRPPGRL